jgi:hypothetical protein
MLMAFNDSSARAIFVWSLGNGAYQSSQLTSLLDASPGQISDTTADFDDAPNSLANYEVQ